MSNALTPDELTDATSEYLYAQRLQEPHKGGWLLACGGWVDDHSYESHAKTCADCRTATTLLETPRNG